LEERLVPGGAHLTHDQKVQAGELVGSGDVRLGSGEGLLVDWNEEQEIGEGEIREQAPGGEKSLEMVPSWGPKDRQLLG
jgi:hypothetical protein